ncbi:Pentapeptide repeats (8 copies) [compost metagenome]
MGNDVVKGFKVFNPDWTCRSFQYALGGTYTHEGQMELCGSGFHFCEKLENCFNYYDFNVDNKVAEVEAFGEVESGNDKSVTNKIRVVRELTWHEVLELVNLGRGNTGLKNSGDYNSGNRNSGNYNSGDYNSGNRNSGDYNSGNRNSGDFNSTNYSTGSFCSIEQPFLLFNQPSPISRDEFKWSEAGYICRRLRVTDDEGKQIDYKQAWSNLWESLSNSEKITVQSIPNFDASVFEEITGVRV